MKGLSKHILRIYFLIILTLFIIVVYEPNLYAAPLPKNLKSFSSTKEDFCSWRWEPKYYDGIPSWESVLPPEDLTEHFVLAGWGGDTDTISFNDEWIKDSHSAPDCTRFEYSPTRSDTKGWAGNLWLDAAYPGFSKGLNMRNVKKLKFWAKGEHGGEKIEFRIGSTWGVSPQPSFSTGIITLSKSWRKYSISLKKRANLKYVYCGFRWIAFKELNPTGCIFYVDDMRFE